MPRSFANQPKLGIVLELISKTGYSLLEVMIPSPSSRAPSAARAVPVIGDAGILPKPSEGPVPPDTESI